MAKQKEYKGKPLRLGGGGKFAKVTDQIKKEGYSEESAKAIAASIGRKKHGDAKMQKMAATGRKRAAKKGK